MSQITATILGIGNVGQAIAGALLKHGVTVLAGARDPTSKSVVDAKARFPALTVLPVVEAVQKADFIFLAVPFQQGAAAVAAAGAALEGKVLVDCTNPVNAAAGFTHSLDSKHGSTELLQTQLPKTHVVKAFTVIGFQNMEDPTFPGYGKAKPAMLIAGDHKEAKDKVAALLTTLGWEPVDCGPATNAVHLEHITLLWIKLAMQGLGPNFVWSILRRE